MTDEVENGREVVSVIAYKLSVFESVGTRLGSRIGHYCIWYSVGIRTRISMI